MAEVADRPVEAWVRSRSDIDHYCRVIARRDFCRISSEAMRATLLAADMHALDDWHAFRESWSRMPLDGYMADGGRYRRRRHATLSAAPSAGSFAVEPHQPHYQSVKHNTLNGGIARHFEPIEEQVLHSRTLRAIVDFGCEVFGRLSPFSAWHIELHQFRIEVTGDGAAAKPTPEGVHRDGVSFVMMVMIDRSNVADGATTIYDLDGDVIDSFTLSSPLEAAVTNDERAMHGVEPIVAIDEGRPAHRDVLVATFRHRG